MALALGLGATSCGYVRTAVKQSYYAQQQARTPRQAISKHMAGRETYFVIGQLKHPPVQDRTSMAVLAVSDDARRGEVVDINHFAQKSAHFGLNLPQGNYQILVVADSNRDGFYEAAEILGGRRLVLDPATAPERVVGDCDIDLRVGFTPELASIRVPVEPTLPLAETVFFPKGTLRTLEDEIFSPKMASLGMYEPAAFLERAPMMFYALEEDPGYKVPVVFVHGINGSARDFSDIVSGLDRRRYTPWFFHYPSGSPLEQMGEMFYRIFLSGRLLPAREGTPLVIVAHSMGGLVVREALNHLQGRKEEARIARLLTLASPLGGHPAVASSGTGPLAIPSWRDLDPGSAFIRNLHRRPLPASMDYHLYYAFGNRGLIRLGENSDGVVPLRSQLPPAAQGEARVQFGFDTTHTGMLHDPAAVGRILSVIREVHSPYPPAHLAELDRGGFQAPLGSDYSPEEAYLIHRVGHWMEALATRRIEPAHPLQAHFVEAVQGHSKPGNPMETAWIKFVRDFPNGVNTLSTAIPGRGRGSASGARPGGSPP